MAATAESIEELYRSRYASFRGGMTAITGSYETARDVVQEAFAQALRDREQFRGEASLAAWVWRIAFRVAMRSRSKGRRELTQQELVEATPLPSPERDPSNGSPSGPLPFRGISRGGCAIGVSGAGHRSSTTSSRGCEQQMSALPSAGGST